MRCRMLLAVVLTVTITAVLPAAEFEVKRTDKGISVFVDGELFTRYLVQSGTKPILFPVIGPTGVELTRRYPIADAATHEKKDHVHHRSFWFTHGDVNGISFWHEQEGGGTIVHREFKRLEGGSQAVIASVNDWIGPDGKKQCEDERVFTFGADKTRRWIDVVITVRASDGPVRFGDTKEGSFGVRVAGSMRVERGEGGRIVNSEGQENQAAWGKPAAWVDYHGPVGGKTLGIAILNHPSSFRFPTYWHVRTYGLFAANPFGLHDFLRDANADGSHSLKKGESFVLRYRVLLHEGNDVEGRVAEAWKEYSGG